MVIINSNEMDIVIRRNNFSLNIEQLEEMKDSSNQRMKVELKEMRDVSSIYLVETTDGYKWELLVSNK